MELTKETIAFLKYFSDINSNFKIETGNRIRCISVERHIYSEAKVTEDFKNDFCIYDLKQFLGILSLFKKPSIDYTERLMDITDEESEGTHMKFIAAAQETLRIPEKELKEPPYEYVLDLKQDDIQRLQSAGNLLKSPHIMFYGDENGVYVKVTDLTGKSGNDFQIKLDSTPNNFKFVIRYEYFKLFPGDYRVHLAEAGMIKFENLNYPVITCVAVERE